MASKKIKADELAITIEAVLADYKDVTEEVLLAAMQQTLKDARADVMARSPDGARTGKDSYKQSWRIQRPTISNGVMRGRVYSLQPHLTHLLEFGHEMRQGGRAEPSPEGGHIAPANTAAQAEFERLIKEGLQR